MPRQLRSSLNQKRRLVGAASFFSIVLAMALLTGSSLLVRAQQQTIALTVSPVVFELSANPGDKLENFIKVTNPSTEPIAVEMQVKPFTGTETGEARVIEEGDPAYSLGQWLTLDEDDFVLRPQETKIVNFIISIPLKAEPGGRYASILATNKQASLDETGAVTVQKVGALVLLRVAGTIEYRARVKEFRTVNNAKEIADKRDQTVFEKPPARFLTRIANDGTVHFKPNGFITISNMFGKKAADLEFPVRNVLPDGDRVFEVEWPEAKIGRYTATLVLNYGDNNERLSATTTFTVFPWKIGLPIIIAGVVLLWFLIARRSRILKALSIIFSRS